MFGGECQASDANSWARCGATAADATHTSKYAPALKGEQTLSDQIASDRLLSPEPVIQSLANSPLRRAEDGCGFNRSMQHGH